jgi:hypothetical protein
VPGLHGYRSGVTYMNSKTIIAVGTSGTDISSDAGKTWMHSDSKIGDRSDAKIEGKDTIIEELIGDTDLNSVQASGKDAIWAVGPKGSITRKVDISKLLKINLF